MEQGVIQSKLLLLGAIAFSLVIAIYGIYISFRPHKKPIFGILTDFGLDFAVASMKGLLFRSLPEAVVIDIDHSLSKFSVLSGSFILAKIYRYFPMRYYFYLCC